MSSVVAIAGIALAYLMYARRAVSAEGMGRALRPAYTLLHRKYFMDELYEDIIVRRVFYGWMAYALDWVDKSVVDKVVNFCGWLGANTGTALRQIQTGQLQAYGMGISVGILIIFGIFLFIR